MLTMLVVDRIWVSCIVEYVCLVGLFVRCLGTLFSWSTWSSKNLISVEGLLLGGVTFARRFWFCVSGKTYGACFGVVRFFLHDGLILAVTVLKKLDDHFPLRYGADSPIMPFGDSSPTLGDAYSSHEPWSFSAVSAPMGKWILTRPWSSAVDFFVLGADYGWAIIGAIHVGFGLWGGLPVGGCGNQGKGVVVRSLRRCDLLFKRFAGLIALNGVTCTGHPHLVHFTSM